MDQELYKAAVVTLKYTIKKMEKLEDTIKELGWPEDNKDDYEYGDYEKGYDCALHHTVACVEDTIKGLKKEMKQLKKGDK